MFVGRGAKQQAPTTKSSSATRRCKPIARSKCGKLSKRTWERWRSRSWSWPWPWTEQYMATRNSKFKI
ncbi:hypothetical protein HanXRQr2_Chr03g0130571 [Helianthus annuus]|uniref:Uncharacterized protein n=1 Tax=Helianthus annuus TaxID=4232 RepID=A0A9K3NXE0_HELAN|nr:hypothetical protein HanXRQr2_Chr03g0130571 [Helianthus annuus]